MKYAFLIIVVLAVIAVTGIAAFSNFGLNNEQYDRLKWIVLRWSYLVAFLTVIVKTFDIPYGIETVTIVAAIGAMLSGLLGVSSSTFQKIIDGTETEEGELEESEVE